MNLKDEQFNEEICVKIKTLDNHTLDVRIKQSSTVNDLKNLIEISSTIPSSRQRLLFKGRQLNNEDTLVSLNIEDQCVVHLVANMPEFESSPLNRGLSTSSIDEHDNRNSFDVQESRRNSRKKVLQQRLHGFQQLPTRNSLQQNVMTLHNLLQSFNTVAEVIEQGQIFAQKDFELGQWIDFKDSYGEWLEGYIGQKQQNQVLIIHQNGEEWIGVPSLRLALFRSHTIQKTYHMSPILNNHEQQQLWTFSELLGQTAMLLSRAGNMMSRLADSVEDKSIPQNKKADMSNLITGMIEEQRRIQEEKVEKQDDVTSLKSMKSMKSDKISIDYETSSIKSMKYIVELIRSDISKLTTYFIGHNHNTMMAENIAEEEENSSQDMSVDNQRDAANISKEFKENYAYYETSLLAAQLAPLADRLGRLLVDLSPYLALSGANINNIFQNHPNSNISNLSIITNEGSQYSTQAKQYYFQVPILLTPFELHTQSQQGISANRIVGDNVDILNHLNNNNNSNSNSNPRQKKISKKEEEEKQQFVTLSKYKPTQQYHSSYQQQQQQQQLQQQQQQQQQQYQQQMKEANFQVIDQDDSQQLQQYQSSKKQSTDGQIKKKKKGKEVSFSEQINQLKKDKQF
ncbi:unnamed protein product (macronuclear) [Paramecium tetraurelia]|uniref:Chromosome undetermined scaffold_1, whole genome shotgun sequence n=1 Tax=Paramecium tetraurelia TaxID=5888 RepID=Q6BGD9_PARTE|nr:hypothetical protein [Paramecium tetraurelia strain d4-2]XP_001423424.1 uncharacterized protein GSPATT00000461001 [Paramecium tetraurelia]CAH03281.1 hypothetical protein with homology to ubiquitin [Paramecium tetraurelia]CAK56026.1 unnamed protein product [Paramecium tetraurelia]|eukprot:XP_001423424.1 hypothetical protein (macronuclear) [Paramecium tetraurelia strain d4-2]